MGQGEESTTLHSLQNFGSQLDTRHSSLPPALVGPLVQLGVSCPRSFPNSFPFPTLAPAPPSPTSIGSQVPSSGWRGPGGLHNLSEALLKPRSAGRPRDLRGAGLTPGLGPPHPRTRPLATREGGSWGLRLPEGGGAGDVGTAGR